LGYLPIRHAPKLTAADIRRALNSLPEDLDETYTRILKAIPPQHLPQTIRLLQFLVFSNHPLRIEEAVDVLAVGLEKTPHFDTERRLLDPEETTRYCSGLTITVTKLKKDPYAYREVTILQLAHFSVKEYLTSNTMADPIAAHLDESVARGLIANVCLAYLLNIDLDPRGDVSDDYAFTEFAALNWMENAVATKTSKDLLVSQAMALFSDSNRHKLSGQWNRYDEAWYNPQRPDDEPTPLFACVSWGFH
jgi:hypothetical protein